MVGSLGKEFVCPGLRVGGTDTDGVGLSDTEARIGNTWKEERFEFVDGSESLLEVVALIDGKSSWRNREDGNVDDVMFFS